MIGLTIEAEFSDADIERWLQQDFQGIIDEIVDELSKAGERFKFKAKAKSKAQGGFGNITFNLRSSIGYIVGIDGKEIKASFTAVNGGNEGVKIGKEYARARLAENNEGIVLIVVAGMEYGKYVQELRKRDVIQGAYLSLADELINDFGA